MPCILQCSKSDKKPLYAYPFNNSFGLPDTIVKDIYEKAFNECVSMTSINYDSLSKDYIDSICKCAKIGIPYRQYHLNYYLPICSLVCKKPFTSYCFPSYEWCIPILNGLGNPIIRYHKRFIRRKPFKYGDSIWCSSEISSDNAQIKVVDYWHKHLNRVPVFIGLEAYHKNLFTIPGYESDIFGIIPSHWIDTSFISGEARNPCSVFNEIRALLSKDTGSTFKPIVKLPDVYKNFGGKTKHP